MIKKDFNMIFVNEPVIEEEEKKLVAHCMDTGWISSSGSFIPQFEEIWSSYCGTEFGIAVSNGTAALEIAVRALELKPGDEVILPAFTIISCINAIIKAGAKPVLVDCTPDTWCIDPNLIEEKISNNTRAIMVVHMYGHPVDMDPILRLSEKYNLVIIEDAAEAHGARYKDKICGGIGHIATFSFFANKIITTGEGGMVITNNRTYADRARNLRNLCFDAARNFEHSEIAFNYRLTNLQAAIGCAQANRISDLVKKKRDIAQYYLKALSNISVFSLPVEKSWAKNVYWMFGIVLDENAPLNTRQLRNRLSNMGVETRPFFMGMHRQPAVLNLKIIDEGQFPVTDRISKQGFYIPSGLNLTREVQEEVIYKLKTAILSA